MRVFVQYNIAGIMAKYNIIYDSKENIISENIWLLVLPFRIADRRFWCYFSQTDPRHLIGKKKKFCIDSVIYIAQLP